MKSLKDLWCLVQEEMKRNISEVIYEVWLSDIVLESFEGTKAVLAIGEFKRKIIEQKFYQVICDAFENVLGFSVNVELVEPLKEGESRDGEKKGDGATSDSNEKNTFDTFVVGSSNRFAHAAAIAVAATPGDAYNPLFIYGNSGLGKTHLLCAISHEIKRKNPDANIIFTGGEDFVNLIIGGIEKKKMQEIHNKYRTCDVLLVDDIQFIAGKPSTQEEFFHTFNALTQAGSQIVLTSDRPPKEILTLDERLRTRFEWGLIADIQPPDIETRMAIIKRKAQNLDFEIPHEVVQYIAEKIKSNIRQLEGAVKRLKAFVTIHGASLNIATAQMAIRDILNDSRPTPVTVERIIQEVARTHGAPPEDIRSKKKDAQTAKMRRIAMHVVREVTDLSTPAIGEEFGGRDHSTVLFALNKAKQEIDSDSSLRAMVADIIKNVKEE